LSKVPPGGLAAGLRGLYSDPETGSPITTHSMLKTFRRCPKQADYKYYQRLKPRTVSKPLRQGTWMHKLQEVHYKGGDWEAEHKKLSRKFMELFDEERDVLGDLPVECERMMRSYLWHYKADNWKVHETEFVLETDFPDGSIYRAKIDLLVEDQFGLWIVDHKWNKNLPNLDFQILDAQSALYVWAALRNKLPVQGHIWNYGRRKPPTIPKLLKDGTRLYATQIETDYPTFRAALKAYGLDPDRYANELKRLKKQRFVPGGMQRSPFFRRSILEKSPAMLKQVAREGYHTAKRMNAYDFARTEFVERVPDRSCTFMCSYVDLCTMELFGGHTVNLRKSKYKLADPLDYYNDDPKNPEEEG